jgi:hypothetical protein
MADTGGSSKPKKCKAATASTTKKTPAKDSQDQPRKTVSSALHYVHLRDTARASRASDANRAFGTFSSFRATGAPRINEDLLAGVSARADDVYMGRTGAKREEAALGFAAAAAGTTTQKADQRGDGRLEPAVVGPLGDAAEAVL